MTLPRYPFPHFPRFPRIDDDRRGTRMEEVVADLPHAPFRFFRLSTCSKVFWLGQFRTLVCRLLPIVLFLPLNFRRVYHVVHFTTTTSFFCHYGTACSVSYVVFLLLFIHLILLSLQHHTPLPVFSFFLSDVTYPLNTCLVQSDSLPLSLFSLLLSLAPLR